MKVKYADGSEVEDTAWAEKRPTGNWWSDLDADAQREFRMCLARCSNLVMKGMRM